MLLYPQMFVLFALQRLSYLTKCNSQNQEIHVGTALRSNLQADQVSHLSCVAKKTSDHGLPLVF